MEESKEGGRVLHVCLRRQRSNQTSKRNYTTKGTGCLTSKRDVEEHDGIARLVEIVNSVVGHGESLDGGLSAASSGKAGAMTRCMG